MNKSSIKHALWIPSLYFVEGLPYVAVNVLSVIFYKILGLDNDLITFYTSSFYLPWLIKPLWSPIVEMFKSSKFWISFCQFFCGVMFAFIAYTIPTDGVVKFSLVFFWLAAFASATHDIAADGFYIKVLDTDTQAFWVGIRNTFYRIAMIFCQGGLVFFAGYISNINGDYQFAWQIVFAILAIFMVLFAVYHFFILPKKEDNYNSKPTTNFFEPFKTFFLKPNILLIIAFLLLYRLSEAQLVKITSLFLLDSIDKGGLALSQSQLGIINGTFGLIALIIGGILGGMFISKKGLSKSLIIMILALNLPDIFYVIMAIIQTQSFAAVAIMVSIEQLGYGFGFTAYTVFMMQVAKGSNSSSHYAVCTAFMAVGMMLPGMISGLLQQFMGYTTFFIWVTLCALPSLFIAFYIRQKQLFTNKDA